MRIEDFAISTNVFARYSLKSALQVLKKAGFRRIELWGHVSQMHPDCMTLSEARELAGRVRSEGFEIVAFHPEGEGCPWNPASERASVRERAVAYYGRCLELVSTMEIGRMIVHPGYGLLDHLSEAELDAAAESWHAIGKRAGELNVEMELLHCTATHLGSLEQLRRLAERADAGLGICADVSLLTLEEIERELQSAEVRGFRLADGPGGHLAFGEGRQPMQEICRKLSERCLLKRSILSLNNRKYILDPDRAVLQSARQIESWQ